MSELILISEENLEKIKEEICEEYCKIPGQYESEDWEANMETYCKNCPLDRL